MGQERRLRLRRGLGRALTDHSVVELVETTLRHAGCVFAEDEAALLIDAASTSAQLDSLLARRVAGEPLEQILGWAEFCGLRVVVEPSVFVPRRRSALLVRETLALLAGVDGPVVVDLCCGTGAIGAAVAAGRDDVELHASDIDPVAVRCARRNLDGIGAVHEGDLFDALPADVRGRVDLLVVNAPYVPTESIALMPPEARDHEPHVTLDGGPDGVDVHRRVAARAGDWMRPDGHLVVETGRSQAALTSAALADHGFDARVLRSDDLDATAVIGTRPHRR